MIILILGASHTGKTLVAQKLLEKHKLPYLSIDHLKMGLIRSAQTKLKPSSDIDELTAYLWPILAEIIKTNIENNQHLIIEGCYVPHDYSKYFKSDELTHIKAKGIVFSKAYIDTKFDEIMKFSQVIEKRMVNDTVKAQLVKENIIHKTGCDLNNISYVYVENEYDIDHIITNVSEMMTEAVKNAK